MGIMIGLRSVGVAVDDPYMSHEICIMGLPITDLSAYIDRLVQERRNSSALAMKLRLSCTNRSPITEKITYNGVSFSGVPQGMTI